MLCCTVNCTLFNTVQYILCRAVQCRGCCAGPAIGPGQCPKVPHCWPAGFTKVFSTAHSSLYTGLSTHATAQYTPGTAYSTIGNSHCTLGPPHYILVGTAYSTLDTSHYTLGTPHYVLGTSYSTLGTSHYTLDTPHYIYGTAYFNLGTLHYTLGSPHYILVGNAYSTLGNSHYTLGTAFSNIWFFSLYTWFWNMTQDKWKMKCATWPFKEKSFQIFCIGATFHTYRESVSLVWRMFLKQNFGYIGNSSRYTQSCI